MLNHKMIAAAKAGQFTLEVASQITGVPARLIAAHLKPVRKRAGVELYSLSSIVEFFLAEEGQRWLRKLRQNQLEIYRDCQATWRDNGGVVHVAEQCTVEVRGRRAEITLSNGHRLIRRFDDPAFRFKGTKV